MDYSEQRLQKCLQSVSALDEAAMRLARERQAKLAKPPGSLGKLEDISIQLAGITGRVKNKVDHKRVIVLAADNGVVAEGVSSSPQSVTLSQTINLTRGITGASSIAKHFGNDLVVVDVGVNAEVRCPAVIDRKIAMGTKNLYREPAMTRDQAVQGILTGIDLAADAKADGVEIVGVGEMGIGNTTTSSAVLSCLTGLSAEATTGRGGGVTDSSFLKKTKMLRMKTILHLKIKMQTIQSSLARMSVCHLTTLTSSSLMNAIDPFMANGELSLIIFPKRRFSV